MCIYRDGLYNHLIKSVCFVMFLLFFFSFLNLIYSLAASPGSLDPVVIYPVPGDSTGGTVRKVVVVRNTEAVTR